MKNHCKNVLLVIAVLVTISLSWPQKAFADACIILADDCYRSYAWKANETKIFSLDPKYYSSYSIELSGHSMGNYENGTYYPYDPVGDLYENGVLIGHYDDNAGNRNFRIDRTLDPKKSYLLKVWDYYHKPCAYTIDVTPANTDSVGNEASNAFVLKKAANTNSFVGEFIKKVEKINYSGDIDYYKFTPYRNGVFQIFTNGANTDTVGKLYKNSVNSSAIATGFGTSSSNKNMSIRQDVLKSFPYYVKVYGNESSTTGQANMNVVWYSDGCNYFGTGGGSWIMDFKNQCNNEDINHITLKILIMPGTVANDLYRIKQKLGSWQLFFKLLSNSSNEDIIQLILQKTGIPYSAQIAKAITIGMALDESREQAELLQLSNAIDAVKDHGGYVKMTETLENRLTLGGADGHLTCNGDIYTKFERVSSTKCYAPACEYGIWKINPDLSYYYAYNFQ